MLTRDLPARDSADKIKVVILEDGRYDRLGMTTELGAEPDIELVCATAQPGELLTAIAEHRPEVAVIDLRIYDDDAAGLDVIRELKRTTPSVKVIVLTAFPELTNFVTASELGVEAFVKKAAAAPRPTLSELIRLVAADSCYYDPDVTRAMCQRLAGLHPPPEDEALTLQAPVADPSERELEVLHLLAAGRRDQQIADALVITKNTVKTHVRNIKAKLGATDRREAVLIAAARDLLKPPSKGK